MKSIISDKIARIIKNKKRLEKILELKIANNGKEVKIEGTPENEYIGEQVIEAINLGFDFRKAISIKEVESFEFKTIHIKDYTKKDNIERIRGRIIGKGGRALATLSELTKCYIEIKDNEIGIIGEPEYTSNAIEAIIQIIQGAKHSNVYKGLEKNQPKPIYDLGLREEE